MRRYGFPPVAALAAGIVAAASTTAAAMGDDYHLTGPYTHRDLAIYLIHREAMVDAPVPLTLEEAMARGSVEVVETGDVETLVIRNRGEREVFIQSGDIVKGGMQDRVLTVSMVVPPHSGEIPVDAFCVEQGRWSPRDGETVTGFSASTARLPSSAGRIAAFERLRREIGPGDSGGRAQPAELSLQAQVWESIHALQANLRQSLKSDVRDARSPSSLQLSLESSALASALEDYEAALHGLAQEHEDAVGYVFAVDGRIDSGDEFGSAGLFRKLWPRLLKAAATVAVAREDAPARGRPTPAEIAVFIDEARAVDPLSRSMPGGTSLETRRTETVSYTEVRRGNGRWVHRSFIAVDRASR